MPATILRAKARALVLARRENASRPSGLYARAFPDRGAEERHSGHLDGDVPNDLAELLASARTLQAAIRVARRASSAIEREPTFGECEREAERLVARIEAITPRRGRTTAS